MDLLGKPGFSVGALITQGAHAAVAAIHKYQSCEETKAYLNDLDSMHKITLAIPDETSIKELSDTLNSARIDHYLWMEMPENIPTALAIRPYPKEFVKDYFTKLKLFK
ncbi:hypothetical protein Ciccas_012782 [Cichlidogyrus casuarinus]|uniref:peptidyl-tRNA hydrolase n=1 Tax=Cichlidogyrus casuarinus TaxID=1844966 RepID=A0ABD2PPS2_9PLAT